MTKSAVRMLFCFCESPSHGGFVNNIEVVGETLKRIVGAAALDMPVDDLVGLWGGNGMVCS